MNGYRPNGIRRCWPQGPSAQRRLGDPALSSQRFGAQRLCAALTRGGAAGRFYLGRREFDPVCLGYPLTTWQAREDQPDLRCLGKGASPEEGRFEGGFAFDTTVRGNRNTGHEFNGDGTSTGNGVIGRRLEHSERLAIIEFLKTQ